jgi:oligopeptidase B
MSDARDSARMPSPPDAPRAPRHPTELRHRDDVRVDDWYWLRDRDDPAVRAHLEAENAYTDASLAPLAPVRAQVFEEIKARVLETDVTAPVRRGTHEYFTRTLEGRQYAVHCRRPVGAPTPPRADDEPGTSHGETVLLDENVLARPDEYFALRGLALSPAQELLAYAVDRTGGELAELRVRDVARDEDLPDRVSDVYYGLAWADEETLFYVRPDETLRPFQVWRHRLGTPVDDDGLVYEERDERFYVSVHRARSGGVLVIGSESKRTTEAWLVDTARPTAPARLVAARVDGVEYSVEHHRSPAGDEQLFLVTNADGAENFAVMAAPVATPGRDHWRMVVAPRDDVRVDGVDAFSGYLVLSERAGGLARLRALDLAAGTEQPVSTGDDVATVGLGSNPEYDTTVVRVVATSLVTPTTDYDHDLRGQATTVVKRQPVAGYDPDRYETRRLWAVADDGTRVPISLVRPRGHTPDGTDPLMLYGYGAYEISIDPTFSVSRLSLLERGGSYAIAHVRGGGELGRRWYDDGKLDHKRNTFTDLVACARELAGSGYAAPDRIVIRGGSAGGLLMGAALNLAPERWRAVIAEVPFVDVLTTILDPSLPLTITEWDEWGNPGVDDRLYDYIRSYSPYDNVAPLPYPPVLATAGVNDPRVQYWEPTKWVQRLRAASTSDAAVVLKVELGAGHHGRSGRYDTWREEAFVLAFALDALGLTR